MRDKLDVGGSKYCKSRDLVVDATMRDTASGGNFYDASNQGTLRGQYSNNTFYGPSSAANEASSSNFSFYDSSYSGGGGTGSDLHFETPQHELPSTYNIHQQQEQQSKHFQSLPFLIRFLVAD